MSIPLLLFSPLQKAIKTKKKESYTLQDRYQFQGLPISVENKAGSIRRSKPGEKPKWSTKMGYDYGYIRNTEAKDGEAVDVYVNRKSKGKKVPYHDVAGGELVDQAVYVIHQLKIWHSGKWPNGICPDCKKHHTECTCPKYYDEDKVMLGFDSKDDAIKAYLQQYDSKRFLGPVSTYTLPEFKAALKRSFGKKLPKKESKHEHWYGFDLDGTLAKDDGWKGKDHIGEPIEKTRKRIEKLLSEGKKVKIFTARAYDPKAIPPIKEWLKQNNIPLLEITNKKDPGMINIYDDRAVQVHKNTGNLVKSFYVDFDKSCGKPHEEMRSSKKVVVKIPPGNNNGINMNKLSSAFGVEFETEKSCGKPHDMDKSYLGQPGDPGGSHAMLRENIKPVIANYTLGGILEEIDRSYATKALPGEDMQAYTARFMREYSNRQVADMLARPQNGTLLKAFVRAHQMKTKGGKTVTVKAHFDKRVKHGKESVKGNAIENDNKEIKKQEGKEIKIYRSILLDEDENIKKDDVGTSWTLDVVFAEDHAKDINRHLDKDNVIILESEVNEKDIDWDNTLFSLENRKNEYEIVLNSGIDLKVRSHDYSDVEIDHFSTKIKGRDFEDYTDNYEGEKTKEDLFDLARDFDGLEDENENLEKAFVRAHTRKGKQIGPYFTKRIKKVAVVKHKALTRVDYGGKEAKAKIKELHKKKEHNELHIDAANEMKAKVEAHKQAGNTAYKVGEKEHHVDKVLKDLNDHIKHHTNEKKSHDNHIEKIEKRYETEAQYWEKKREEKKETKGYDKAKSLIRSELGSDKLTSSDVYKVMLAAKKKGDDSYAHMNNFLMGTRPDLKDAVNAAGIKLDVMSDEPKRQTKEVSVKKDIDKQRYYSDVDKGIFRDSVSSSVQNDGQKLLDAVDSKDLPALNKLILKYQKDAGRDQGGGGAGPGKVKQARPGTAQLWSLAISAEKEIKSLDVEEPKKADIIDEMIRNGEHEGEKFSDDLMGVLKRMKGEEKPSKKVTVKKPIKEEISGEEFSRRLEETREKKRKTQPKIDPKEVKKAEEKRIKSVAEKRKEEQEKATKERLAKLPEITEKRWEQLVKDKERVKKKVVVKKPLEPKAVVVPKGKEMEKENDTFMNKMNNAGYSWERNTQDKWAWFHSGKQVSGAFPDKNDSKNAAYELESKVDREAEKEEKPEPSITTHPEFKRLEQVYGSKSVRELREKVNEMNTDISSLQRAARREFNQMGGRRTSAAVSAEGARGIGQEKLLLNSYIDYRLKNEKAKSA